MCKFMVNDEQRNTGKGYQKKLEFDSHRANKKRVLKMLCFSSAECLKNIMEKKPHNLILASGTLSPMDLFAEELKI